MLREEAIKKHRAMWNWIAEQILNHVHTMNIGSLKAEYIGMQGEDTLEMHKHNNCYLCHYTDINCRSCPLSWPTNAANFKCEVGYYDMGLYSRCANMTNTGNWRLQAELAYEIANLPERGDVK